MTTEHTIEITGYQEFVDFAEEHCDAEACDKWRVWHEHISSGGGINIEACGETEGEALAEAIDQAERILKEGVEWHDEAYTGFDSLTEYAESLLEDGCLGECEESLAPYLDMTAFGRDLEIGGDVFVVDGVGVFRSNI